MTKRMENPTPRSLGKRVGDEVATQVARVTFLWILYKCLSYYGELQPKQKFCFMRIILTLAIVLFLFGCNTKSDVQSIFKRDNLLTQQFHINPTIDTVIRTANGAALDIPKGSITSDEPDVMLEIKEAYSISDIVKAGLITNSNGQLLSSGGMIYINAVGGNNTKIVKPIRISIPTKHADRNMQLYKGDTSKDGKINWVDPKPIASNADLTAIDSGKVLFQQNCATCHAFGKDLFGPDLAHFGKRFAGEGKERGHLLEYFTHGVFSGRYRSDSSDNYLPSNYELYACNLRNMFGGAIGYEFSLTPINWKAVYDYVESESNRLSLPLPHHAYLNDCVDSCAVYNAVTAKLYDRKNEITEKRQKLIKDNGAMTKVTNIQGPPGTGSLRPIEAGTIPKVSPEVFDAEYYQFTIETFGWYNIDDLLKNVTGVEMSDLFVRIKGSYIDRINIFLIIPSKKVNDQGGPSGKTENEYIFFTYDGKIPLPQGDKCYILAVTESNEEIAYAIKEFHAAKSQSFEMELNKVSKDGFTEAMKIFDLPGISINVHDAKNAAEIRVQDSTLKQVEKSLLEAEYLRPKMCDCNCLADSTRNK
jgi:hypothetical protein